MELLAISEIAEQLGITPAAAKQRIYKRNIKPIKYFGKAAAYQKEVVDQIKDYLPTGRRSPKYGKIRPIIERVNDELDQQIGGIAIITL
jgi:hypothetical protein